MPAHVRVVEVDMLDFDSDRIRIFATALMPFEYAARMQPRNTREHTKRGHAIIATNVLMHEYK